MRKVRYPGLARRSIEVWTGSHWLRLPEGYAPDAGRYVRAVPDSSRVVLVRRPRG